MLDWLNPKQNQDPTLKEKRWGLFQYGEKLAWTILISGTIIAYLGSIWFGNLIQAMFVAVFDPQYGFFNNHWDATKEFMKGMLFSSDSFLRNSTAISNLVPFGSIFLLQHGNMVASIIHVIGFLILEYFVFRIFINIYVKSRNLNHNEYGDDRIATPSDIKKETNKVPDRTISFDHSSGVIAMHQFNWRGRMNKNVKQQMNGIQDYLKMDDRQLKCFKFIALIIITIVSTSLILGTIIDSIKYAFNPSSIAWYSPYRVIKFLYDLLHLCWRITWNTLVFLPNIQWDIFKLDIYWMIPILIIEVLLIGWFIFHIKDVAKAYKHSFIQAMLERFVDDIKRNPIKQSYKNMMTYIKLMIDDMRDKKLDALDNENDEEIKKEQIRKQFPWSKAIDKFYHHPLLASKLLYLNILNSLFALDHGLTGYYYLNTKQQNSLVYGITRSGKGQMLVNTTIDINSRASYKYQKNMIINDPKGELASGSYKMLRKRGYDVKVLNIMDMSHSMSYNPLNLVITNARNGSIGEAATACSELSYTIYDATGQEQNAYFYMSAASLFDSMVFAQLALAHSRYYGLDDLEAKPDLEAWSKITINNILQMTSQLGGEKAMISNDNSSANRLIVYFTHLEHELEELRRLSDNDPENLNDTQKDHLNILDQAVGKFQQSKMAGDQAAGSIYSTFLERLRIYQQPDVAKMTSMNNFDMEELGFDRLLTIQFNRKFRLQSVTAELYGMYFEDGKLVKNDGEPIEIADSHLSNIGLVKIPFEKEINYKNFCVDLIIHDERVSKDFKFSIQCTKKYYDFETVKAMKADYKTAPKVADIVIKDGEGDQKVAIDRYTRKPVLREIEMNVIEKPSRNEFSNNVIGFNELNLLSQEKVDLIIKEQLYFLYNPRPTALFLVTPPNRKELNQLCTFLINQSFSRLSDLALRITKGQHIQRDLQMILDELGNLPAIPQLDTKASIGLSQHIEMILVFQDREQADNIYKKNVTDIVLSNCSTTYYILSRSDATIKSISEAFGKRTVFTTSLNHDPTKMTSANYNSNSMAQDVMPQGTLRNLKTGEVAILRANDRSTVWGKDTEPRPIFDTGNFILPYAWWFLSNDFVRGSLNTVPIVTPHKYLDLESLTIHFNRVYEWMESKDSLDKSYSQTLLNRIKKIITTSHLNNKYQKLFIDRFENLRIKKDRNEITGNQLINFSKNIEKEVKAAIEIQKINDVNQVGHFVLDVLSKNQSNIRSELALIKTNKQLEHVFNLIYRTSFNDETGIQFPIDSKKYIRDINHNIQENEKYGGSKLDFVHLNTFITICNSYLKDINFIKLKDDSNSHFILTEKGKHLATHPELINDFFDRKVSISYEPIQPIHKMVINIFNNLNTNETRSLDNIGLLFIRALCDNEMYEQFITPRDGDDKYTDISRNVFSNLMLYFFDLIVQYYSSDIINPKLNGNKEISTDKMSDNSKKLMKKLEDINEVIEKTEAKEKNKNG